MSNPYMRLFYQALESRGVVSTGEFELSPLWLWRRRHEVDVLHFHWVEWLWRPHAGRRLAKLLFLLLLAKVLGVLVVWTMHNIEPHRGGGRADRVGFRIMARLADIVVCHSKSAAESARRVFDPRGRVLVVPHGNYADWYPRPKAREEVLKDLGLRPDRPVVACVGHIRSYKGLETACAAARELGEEVQLLIAGKPEWDYDVEGLRARMADLPYSALVPRSLSDQEVADFVHASDLILLPYRAITGSGALLMAWTLERSVVASDLPYFREMITRDSAAGWLFEAGNAIGLAHAIRHGLATTHEARADAAGVEAARYDWDSCIAPLLNSLGRARQC